MVYWHHQEETVTQAKLGIVGCGYWGAKHVRSLHELGDCEIIACDSNPRLLGAIQRTYPSVSTTERYQDLLDTDVEGVIVATPMSSHFEIARQFLLSGKDVLVEKPLTTDVDQAETLVEIAERRQAVLMVGHTFVYNPAIEAVAKLITDGDLGDIYYLDLARLNLGLFQTDANVLWDLAPHDLSILLFLVRENPIVVSARGAAHVNQRVHDNAHLDLTFTSGARAHVHVSWLEPRKVRRVTVVGTQKMVICDDVAPSDKVWIYDKGITLRYQTDSFDDFHLSYRYGNTTILRTAPEEPLQLEQRDFIGCLKERRRPRSDGFTGLQVVRLLELAQQSLERDGSPVRVGQLIGCSDPRLGAGLESIVAARATAGRLNGVAKDLVGDLT